jgi:hypothetical protein
MRLQMDTNGSKSGNKTLNKKIVVFEYAQNAQIQNNIAN